MGIGDWAQSPIKVINFYFNYILYYKKHSFVEIKEVENGIKCTIFSNKIFYYYYFFI